MILERGRKAKALKVLVYGPEGIGKTTFAMQFPNPVFIDTEGSTDHFDVVRAPKPQSWAELRGLVQDAIANPSQMGTLVIDTADWAERLCMDSILVTPDGKKKSIEDIPYGKGYTMVMEEYGRLLDDLSRLVDKGVNVVITAHAAMRTVTLPEETGSYDRWELKMQKKTSPMVKEWADMILFANYKTMLMKDEKSGKTKAHGGQRVMYTSHTTNWDAKNRFGLPPELPFDYNQIAGLIPTGAAVQPSFTPVVQPQEAPPMQEVPKAPPTPSAPPVAPVPAPAPEPVPEPEPEPEPTNYPTPSHSKLYAMMRQSNLTESMVCGAIEHMQFYPKGTPITMYAPDFIEGFILPNWKDVVELANKIYDDLPF